MPMILKVFEMGTENVPKFESRTFLASLVTYVKRKKITC
jgi:hypothetical protein